MNGYYDRGLKAAQIMNEWLTVGVGSQLLLLHSRLTIIFLTGAPLQRVTLV